MRLPADAQSAAVHPRAPGGGARWTRRGRFSGMNTRGTNGSKGPTRKRAKAPKRPKGGVTKAQQAARRKFIAESPVKPSREGMEAIHRELNGE